jgi:hypothetical protein
LIAGLGVKLQDKSDGNVNFMDTLTLKQQRGDTEILTRPMPPRADAPRPKEPLLRPGQVNNAYQLKQAVEGARRALAAAESCFQDGWQRQLELAERQRQQFWTDTCRDPHEARAACRQANELYRQHGWRFLTPSFVQVQSVLEALDSALPSWDQEHPALFFQTLELNFPGVLRVLPQSSRH